MQHKKYPLPKINLFDNFMHTPFEPFTGEEPKLKHLKLPGKCPFGLSRLYTTLPNGYKKAIDKLSLLRYLNFDL